MGLTVNLSVPSTVEEFDSNAKLAGACLAEAINNAVYRGSLADFRSEFCDALETKYSINRKTEGTGKFRVEGEQKEEILKYVETEGEFVVRVKAEDNISDADLQTLADEVASKIAFDASARERKPAAPKKLAAKYVEHAKKLIAGGKIDELNKRLHKSIGKEFTQTHNADADATTLGWLVKEFVEWNEAQTIAKLG